MLNAKQFIDIMGSDRTYGMVPDEIEAQDVVNILQEVLLKNEHSPMQINDKQNNTFVLHEILMKYSHRYRKTVFSLHKKAQNPDEGYKF